MTLMELLNGLGKGRAHDAQRKKNTVVNQNSNSNFVEKHAFLLPRRTNISVTAFMMQVFLPQLFLITYTNQVAFKFFLYVCVNV